MKKLISILIVCFCCSIFGAKAQVYTTQSKASAKANVFVDNSTAVSTQISDIRYEFIQSTVSSSQAFLLDKYTGRIWQYRGSKKGLERIKRECEDAVDSTVVNYQLYMSGESSSMCFLLNIHTGDMWRYDSKIAEKIFKKIEFLPEME